MPPRIQIGNHETEAKFVLLDPGAQRSVTSPGIQQRTLPDGRKQVTANMRNRENRRIEVQVNCVFKDDQYFPVDEHHSNVNSDGERDQGSNVYVNE